MRFFNHQRKAVITAMGIAAPGALDCETFWKIVQSGGTGVQRIRRIDTSESGCSFGGEVPHFDISELPAKLKPKRMARHTQLLLWAARQIKSEVEALSVKPSIRLGIATSCLSMISESGVSRAKKGATGASAYMISQCPPHAASGALAQYLETDADVLTVSTACAAGTDAIGLAAEAIINGNSDAVVAGGADCAIGIAPLSEFVNCGLSSIRNNVPEKAARPFDVFADSGVCSEGAGLFLLEEKEAAERRGATILAEVAGYASCIDPDKNVPGSGWPLCLRSAMENAGWNPGQIDSVSAWGPGHPVIDRIEAEFLHDLLGEYSRYVPVYSIKGTIGNPMAAAGPLMAAIAICSMRDGVVPPTANLEIPLPEAALDFVRGRARRCLPQNVLMNAHGVGGANATLLFNAPTQSPLRRTASPRFTVRNHRQVSLINV